MTTLRDLVPTAEDVHCAFASSAKALAFAYFTPFRSESPARARGCLTCTHWHGQFFSGHVLCEREPRWLRVVGLPAMGCAFWGARAWGG